MHWKKGHFFQVFDLWPQIVGTGDAWSEKKFLLSLSLRFSYPMVLVLKRISKKKFPGPKVVRVNACPIEISHSDRSPCSTAIHFRASIWKFGSCLWLSICGSQRRRWSRAGRSKITLALVSITFCFCNMQKGMMVPISANSALVIGWTVFQQMLSIA